MVTYGVTESMEPSVTMKALFRWQPYWIGAPDPVRAYWLPMNFSVPRVGVPP